jgi:hypothetical protein
VRTIARLRAELPALRRGSHVSLAVGDQAYAYARVGGGDPVVVVINNGSEPLDMDVPVRPAGCAEGTVLEDRLGAAGSSRVEDGRLRVTLPRRAAALYAPNQLKRPRP